MIPLDPADGYGVGRRSSRGRTAIFLGGKTHDSLVKAIRDKPDALTRRCCPGPGDFPFYRLRATGPGLYPCPAALRRWR